MSFHQQTFANRFKAMGDEAEGVFEQAHEGKFVRYGLNRPPIGMGQMTAKIRYTPDYMITRALVEVMGVGNDRLLKLKTEKAYALQQWHSDWCLELFLWDSKLKQHTSIEWPVIWDMLTGMPMNTFPEGKQYWEIDVDKHIWSLP